MITFNMAFRFLADDFRGDTCYKISYPDQNLRRCRTQLALVAEMEKNRDKLEAIGRKYFG